MTEKLLEIGKFYEVEYKTIFGNFKTLYGELTNIIIEPVKGNSLVIEGTWIKEKNVISIKEVNKSEFIKLREEVE